MLTLESKLNDLSLQELEGKSDTDVNIICKRIKELSKDKNSEKLINNISRLIANFDSSFFVNEPKIYLDTSINIYNVIHRYNNKSVKIGSSKDKCKAEKIKKMYCFINNI